MITLKQSVDRVMRKLDDEDGDVWPRDQVEGFVIDGYNALCRDVPLLFDMAMYDNAPMACNYTRPFEREYMTGPIFGQFNFTSDDEDEYAGDNSQGPCNHTRPSDAAYMGSTPAPTARRVMRLPDGIVEVSRVTQNWLPLRPEFARGLRITRKLYESMQSGVYVYTQNQDGFFGIRPVGVQTAVVPTVSYTYSTGYFGVIRTISDWGFDTEEISGTYGIIRGVPRHFPSGRFGGARVIIPDDNALRVEYYRLGRSLKSEPFEIPDRAVRYCEYWALYRAYSSPNEGEEKKLADHYKARYTSGAARMKKRIKAEMDERTITMGGKRQSYQDSYLSLFPGDYGYARPSRR